MASNPQDVRKGAIAELARRELATRQQAQPAPVAPAQVSQPPSSPPSFADATGNALLGMGEAALRFGSGMVTSPINEASAAYQEATNPQIGPDMPPPKPVIEPYEPRTASGKAMSGAVDTLMSPITKTIDWSADTENQNPAVRATGHAAKALLSVVGLKGLGRAGEAVNPAVSSARKMGYALDPRQIVEGKPIGSTTQRAAAVLGGKAAIPADASILNQAKTKAMVAEDIGLPSNESISQATIDRLNTVADKAYTDLKGLRNAAGTSTFKISLGDNPQYLQAVQGIGQKATSKVTGQMDPAARTLLAKYQAPVRGAAIGGVIDDIAELRFDARKHFKSDDPAIVKQAKVERQLADALEDSVDQQVSPAAPDLVKNWRDARMQRAKLHTVEDSMVGTDIDPRLLAKAEDSGAKLSGNMRMIAEAARNFPTVMQAGASLGSKSSLGLFDAGASGVGAGIGAALGGVPGALLGAVVEPATRLTAKRLALGPGKAPKPGRPTDPARLGAALSNQPDDRFR